MTETLADQVKVHTHFARSANLERDTDQPLDGYLPTSRAREVLRRVLDALTNPAVGCGFSITGTYGSGKSSLALFLNALLGPDSTARSSAYATLAAVDVDLATAADRARAALPGGAILAATATAQREPITVTLMRALKTAVSRMPAELQVTPVAIAIRDAVEVTPERILGFVKDLAADYALLIVLDEFGKNLEEFASSGGRDADLFILQSLAEWAQQTDHHPVVLLTLQHLAFIEYDQDSIRNREWAKIQGRFADIPYVESPGEAQALIASVYHTTLPVDDWSTQLTHDLDRVGATDLIHIALARLYPLHPLTAAALPDLCARYGQNERTLFSFLAGPDACAVPSLLAAIPTASSMPQGVLLPSIRLHHVYDFFLASAPTMVTSSPHASRWIEIEVRLRDTTGLSDAELRVLKTIAVLNLVASGGSLRASRYLIGIAAEDGDSGTGIADDIDNLLDTLEQRGLVTHREFADEYRIWAGSDYDLKGAIEVARRRLDGASRADLLNRIRPQPPIVASRHSQTVGILRVFERQFVDAASTMLVSDLGQDYDGLVLLSLDPNLHADNRVDVLTLATARPVIYGVATDTTALLDAVMDLAAHREALDSLERSDADWVARRELRERTAAAAAHLDAVIEATYGTGAGGVSWRKVNGEVLRLPSAHQRTLSSILSDLCDERYPHTPIIRNEMLSRRTLTSQGAKARRDLLEAMVTHPQAPMCGIDGYGPERAMYEAVLRASGIHRPRHDSAGPVFGEPGVPAGEHEDLRYGPAWQAILGAFAESAVASMSVKELYLRLMAPPIGMKEGPIPVLLSAALIAHADTVAMYENGTFVPRFDTPVAERLIRNPELFTIRQYALTEQRATITERLAQALGVAAAGRGTRVRAVVGLVGPLLGRARALPHYAQKTHRLTPAAKAVRSALFAATDPETLVFDTLPIAVGLRPFPVSQPVEYDQVEQYVELLDRILAELQDLYPRMLGELIEHVFGQLGISAPDRRVELVRRFAHLKPNPLESGLQAFLHALTDDVLDEQSWAEYLAMVTRGRPPEAWTDRDADAAKDHATQLCQQLRHVESIYFERSTDGQSSDASIALRVGLTRPDGHDASRVVWIDQATDQYLDKILQDTLREVENRLGSSGLEALLAKLANQVLVDSNAIEDAESLPRSMNGETT